MENLETKEFTLLTPFNIVTKEVSVTDSTNDRVITISGCANFTGMDEYGKTYIDMAGDLLNPHGVDTSAWEVNPQVLYQHQRDYTIGKGLSIDKRPEGLFITCEIHADAMTPQDFYRIKSGLVCMFSVGFRTVNSEWIKVDGREVYYIKDCLLLEVSAVSIPCNLKSTFQVLKSMAPDIAKEYKTITKEVQTKETTEETAMINIKVKRADLLTADELTTFKSLGGSETEEVEVSMADYLKQLVAHEVSAVLAAKEKEAQEAAEKAAQELAEKEAAEKALEDARTAEEAAKEEKELEVELTTLKEAIESIKSAITESN